MVGYLSDNLKHTVIKIFVPILLLTLFTNKYIKAQNHSETLPTGIIIDTIKCKANPGYSYALYLSPEYADSVPSPVIFIFDPGANGKSEANLFKDAAEKYGYILVCSHNSRNGSWDKIEKAIDYTMNDAFARFNFDKKRIYTAGFSGGSRAASLVALKTQQIAGVIGYGAGLPPSDKYTSSQIKGFDYIGLIGRKDFNYPEMLELEKFLEKSRILVRLLISDLRHQLPSKQNIMEAVEWMELNAIKKGLSPKNEEFIQTVFKKRIDSISNLEKNGNVLELASNLKFLINDFSGMTDVSIYRSKSDSILKTKVYADLGNKMDEILKLEKKTLEKYYQSAQLIRNESNFADSIYYWWSMEVKFYLKQEKKAEHLKQDMASRLLGSIYMIQYQLGDEFYEMKRYPLAIKSYRLCAEALPDNRYAHYQLACALAMNKNYTASCKTLEKLVELGFKNKKLLLSEPAFEKMKENKRFIEILNKLE